MTVKYEGLKVTCDIMGWVYFASWSIAFYPQVILNYRRKCVIGLSFDYKGIYNFTGFLFYSIYTIATFIHHQGTSNTDNPIAINDIAFAIHAFILTAICCIQILIYDKGKQKPSNLAIYIAIILWTIAIYNITLSAIFNAFPWFGTMSTISFLGYVKVILTPIKYMPQAWMNFVDKSTIGFSIHAVFFDFIGGALSLLQQILSGWNTNDWTFVTGNVPKFLLAVETIVFDIIFMIQHYILYGDNNTTSRQSTKQKRKQKLLNNRASINNKFEAQMIIEHDNMDGKVLSSSMPSRSVNSKSVLVQRKKGQRQNDKNLIDVDDESDGESSTFSAGENEVIENENDDKTPYGPKVTDQGDGVKFVLPKARTKGQWMT